LGNEDLREIGGLFCFIGIHNLHATLIVVHKYLYFIDY
jgi:hypothetical protein